MNSSISNLAVDHSLNVSDDSYQCLFKMDDFSSNQFFRLYFNGNSIL